jgi:hypothetical protein
LQAYLRSLPSIPPLPALNPAGVVVMPLAMNIDCVESPRPSAKADDCQLSVDQIESRLKHSGYRSLRKVGCEVAGDSFVLWGSVPNYHMKQMAQALAGEVVGPAKIKNRIQVRVN